MINLKKLLKLEKKSTEIRQYENLLQDTIGEGLDLAPEDVFPTWVTTPTEFKVDELINKTLEYNYTLEAINKGGIPQ